MWSRLLALLLVVALVPTAELTEQAAHIVEHVLEHEAPMHGAHHDDGPLDCNHGCTGIIHVCTCHHAVALTPAQRKQQRDRAVVAGRVVQVGVPPPRRLVTRQPRQLRQPGNRLRRGTPRHVVGVPPRVPEPR